jgi:hypothetical protein
MSGGGGLPTEKCLPFGIPPGMLSTNLPTKIVHTPAVTLMLFERFNDWRRSS